MVLADGPYPTSWIRGSATAVVPSSWMPPYADPRVQLVGYGPSASTIGANRAGRVAARGVAEWLDAQAPSMASSA